MTKGIIILEGPDGGGKSTLAKALVDKFDARYLHGRYYPTMAFQRHSAMLRVAARESQNRLVVVDRHWISENIYGSTFHGGSAYGSLSRLFHRQWIRFGALYIFCLPPTDTVLKNHRERHEVRGEFYSSVVEVNERYRRLWTGEDDVCPANPNYVDQLTRGGGVAINPTRFMDYDYRYWPNIGPESQVMHGIAWKLETLRKYTWSAGLDHTYNNIAGNVEQAKVIIVGSSTKDDGRSAILWPLWGGHGAAAYLCRALHAIGVDEEDLCFTNIEDGRAIEAINYRLFLNKPLRIVALGKVVAAKLEEKNVKPDAIIPHPGSAKRHGWSSSVFEMELNNALGNDVRRL